MPRKRSKGRHQTAKPILQKPTPASKSRHENKTGGPNTQDAEPSLSNLMVDKQSNDMKSTQNFEMEVDEDTVTSDLGTTLTSTKTESDTIDTSVLRTPSDITALRGPANPGIVRSRNKARLSNLPEGQSAFEVFTSLKKQGFSEEQAVLALISTYNMSLASLNEVSATKLPFSFSNVKYVDIARYVYLDPVLKGMDISDLDIHRARIPMSVFKTIFDDVAEAHLQYGPMASHDNEEARSRYLSSFFTKIVCMFGSAIRNIPESILESEITKKGRIEHLFYAVNSVAIVFLEVKKSLMSGRDRLNVTAQVLAESAACDYVNSTEQHWVPILGILSDGGEFEFFVFDSGIQKVFSSGPVEGIHYLSSPDSFVLSLKRIIEYLFDFFIIGYINGLRSFLHISNIQSIAEKKKRKSTDKWEESLYKAELAHLAFRKAAALGEQKKYEEAENEAENGILLLKESVESILQKVSRKGPQKNDISTYWKYDVIIGA